MVILTPNALGIQLCDWANENDTCASVACADQARHFETITLQRKSHWHGDTSMPSISSQTFPHRHISQTRPCPQNLSTTQNPWLLAQVMSQRAWGSFARTPCKWPCASRNFEPSSEMRRASPAVPRARDMFAFFRIMRPALISHISLTGPIGREPGPGRGPVA